MAGSLLNCVVSGNVWPELIHREDGDAAYRVGHKLKAG
jgi:hypothetical protein